MSTPYIILQQTRVEKSLKGLNGDPFTHAIIDFEPIIPRGQREAHILQACDSPEEALALAKQCYPFLKLAVQPALECLQCHQKPKLSQHSPNSNEQRPGKLYPASNRAR